MTVRRVTTVVPFPRGLVLKDGTLYVLSRGRVRGAGGVDPKLDDRAGTIWTVDPSISEPIDEYGQAVAHNGKVFAEPTDPPFNLLDRSLKNAVHDRFTDRPYCTLRYHEPTHSFYLCGFSGIDKPKKPHVPGYRNFSKNLTDALLRYDTRTDKWYEVERHDFEAGGLYPHHDPAIAPPPHGWLNGPDNVLPVGDYLYAVAKDNSLLVQYDLSALKDDPEAGYPPSKRIIDRHIFIKPVGETKGGMGLFLGHSTLATDGEYLYVGFRTSCQIVRFPLNSDGTLASTDAELVARFDPYDPVTGKSPNLTDMDFDTQGRLYVVSAKPSRVYRFKPDPADVFDARDGGEAPWVDLAKLTGNPSMKSENVLVAKDGRVFITSGDAYGHKPGLGGAVYVVE